jgi:hypothetical protein
MATASRRACASPACWRRRPTTRRIRETAALARVAIDAIGARSVGYMLINPARIRLGSRLVAELRARGFHIARGVRCPGLSLTRHPPI